MESTFFVYLLEVSVCMIAFYGLYHMLLKNDNFFQINRLYLLMSVGLSFIIPVIHVTIVQEFIAAPTAITGTTRIVEQVAPAIDIFTVLFILYGIGILFFTVKFLFNLLYISQLVRHAKIKDCQGFKIAFINSKLPVFSFMRTIFWSNNLSYNDQESEQIIKHEQVHINQRHSLDLMFLELANIVLWFNPIITLYKKNLKIIHEYIADHDLYQTQNYHFEYLDLLIKESKNQQRLTLTIAHPFFNNQLKKRLIMIKNINQRSNKFKLCWGLPLLGALMFCFSFETVTVAQIMPDTDSSLSMRMDTLPVDTMVIFDPVTKTETIKYVTRQPDTTPKEPTKAKFDLVEDPTTIDASKWYVDTIITFDPKTYKETVKYAKRKKQE